ncbi:histidine phosphatase family protein [Lewinella sp. 4G2]|uniref:SixA phosphatase family protein n=1 Tax=Lewinella sp. 4G2 TaxID=1803372 RepID=UPI0007B49035|nr:phosphoglycerate mutase family protein [Lewinella sp. 4G2]OAV45412.1 hypothetical protein A3850_013320 [Lewinella sp. 4G2]
MKLTYSLHAFLLLVLGLFLASCGSAQEKAAAGDDDTQATAVTTFYLVRHAEKQDGEDPALTDEGTERAARLATILADKDIKAVYSTATKRTQMTAAPTAAAYGLTVQDYDAGDLAGFAATVKQGHRGENVLIVGHSNSTPSLANEISQNSTLERFDESDFGNLIVIEVPAEGGATVREDRY